MAYRDLVTINISLEVAGVSREGFGTPLFLDDHVWFTSRTRTYSSLTDAAEDLPTDSPAYRALVQAFSPTVKPSQVKVGRREVDNITFTPAAVTGVGQIFQLTVVGTDLVPVTATFTTSTGSETADDVISDLVADLSGVVGVTVTDNTGTMTLAKSGSDDYSINSIESLTYTTTTSETASEAMAAVTAEDDDFYFLAASDHDSDFVLDLAADVEARNKIYFVAVQEQGNLSPYLTSSTDTLARLRTGSFFRTSGWFHHLADTTYPEMQYITVGSTANPGKRIWANNRIQGSEAAQDPSNSLRLTAGQKSNLNDKNANYTETQGGLNITRRGSVSGSDTFTIDLVRNRDFLEARLSENYQNFLINNPVVPYTDSGIVRSENVLTSTLDRYVSTETQPNILQENNPYTTNFPRRRDVSFGDVTAGELRGTFTAFLAGSIRTIEVSGSLTFEAQS